MPTGYTSDLYEGKDQTFPEFVLSCARAFGALVTLRDEPFDAPIPDELKPSTDYHDQRLAGASQRLVRLRGMTVEDAAEAIKGELRDFQRQRRERNAKADAVRERCQAMLAEVERWKPPTSEHDGLKQFMADQLIQTIKFDGEHSDWPSSPISEPNAWLAAAIEKAERDIKYHVDERAKEIQRTNDRNAWIRALRESLTVGVSQETPGSGGSVAPE